MSTAAPFDFSLAKTGDSTRVVQTIGADWVDRFAEISGDFNPLHMDREFARSAGYRDRVAHGLIVGTLASRLVGTCLPGPGALWTEQQFRWTAPVVVGDTVEVSLTVTGKSEGTRSLLVRVQARNQHGKTVMEGNGVVRVMERRTEQTTVPLAERVALVAGSDLVAACVARRLRQTGARVAVTAPELGTEGVFVCPPEAGPEESVQAAADSLGGPIDVVVSSFGAEFLPSPFLQTEWETMQRHLDLQLRRTWEVYRAALPGMLERGSGRIVTVASSFTSGIPPAQWTPFLVACAAVKELTRCLAAEFGPHGISINVVSPGLVEGDALLPVSDRMRKVQAMQTPLRRLARPEDVSAAVMFLCSDEGGYLAGADIPVCGGHVM